MTDNGRLVRLNSSQLLSPIYFYENLLIQNVHQKTILVY
jgi:hypothetical protein